MTLEESRRAFDEQVAVRYDGLTFERIKVRQERIIRTRPEA